MISSIILAAGMSKRMGAPKALLDWGGEPLLSFQVRQLLEAGADEVIVVLGHRADEIHRRLKGTGFRVMVNPRHQLGRAGSLRIGAKAVNRDAEAIVVMNVDQPRSAEFLRRLIAAHQPAAAATRPCTGERQGHPVVIAGRLRPELMTATDDGLGLRGVLAAHRDEIADFACDESCIVDVNTPEDLAAARALFGINHH